MATDWAADVKKHVANADDAAIAGIVRYLGIALRNRDSSLVSFSDKTETDRVRANFLQKKLGLTQSDAVLDAAIAKVGEAMKGDRTKNRVTVYYLLAAEFKKLSLFVKAPAAAKKVAAAKAPAAKAQAGAKAAAPKATAAKAPATAKPVAKPAGKTAAKAVGTAAAVAGAAAAGKAAAKPAAEAAAKPATKPAAKPAPKPAAKLSTAKSAPTKAVAVKAPPAKAAAKPAAKKAPAKVASGAVAGTIAAGAAVAGAAVAAASGAAGAAKDTAAKAAGTAGNAAGAAAGAVGNAAGKVGDAAGNAAGAVTGAAGAAADKAAALFTPGAQSAKSDDEGGMNWLLWLVVGALLLFALWWYFLRGADDSAASNAPTTEAAATVDAMGGGSASGAAADLAAAPAEGTAAIPDGAGVTTEMRDGEPVVKVYFDTAKTDVVPAFAGTAGGLKGWLEAHPGAKLAISGYSDPSGDAKANAELSKQRAQAVQTALVSSGIPAEAAQLVKPANSADGTVSKEATRRVEVTVQ